MFIVDFSLSLLLHVVRHFIHFVSGLLIWLLLLLCSRIIPGIVYSVPCSKESQEKESKDPVITARKQACDSLPGLSSRRAGHYGVEKKGGNHPHNLCLLYDYTGKYSVHPVPAGNTPEKVFSVVPSTGQSFRIRQWMQRKIKIEEDCL